LNREGGYYLASGAMFQVLWFLVLSKTINKPTCKVETLSVSTSIRQAINELKGESTSTLYHPWAHFQDTKVVPNYTSVPNPSTIYGPTVSQWKAYWLPGPDGDNSVGYQCRPKSYLYLLL